MKEAWALASDPLPPLIFWPLPVGEVNIQSGHPEVYRPDTPRTSTG
jgi:hypothetical protein